jgi:hypothetical protein
MEGQMIPGATKEVGVTVSKQRERATSTAQGRGLGGAGLKERVKFTLDHPIPAHLYRLSISAPVPEVIN